MEDPERKLANELQGKFQFYLVALVFTVLGLAVQSSPTTATFGAHVAELAAWVLLLLAGLAGLSYLEWNPAIRVGMANEDDLREKLRRLRDVKQKGQRDVPNTATGESTPIDVRIAQTEESVSRLSAKIKAIMRKSQVKYFVLKWAFVGGITLLGVSRGYPIAASIIKALAG